MRLALEVVMQNDGDFVEVILSYILYGIFTFSTDEHV